MQCISRMKGYKTKNKGRIGITCSTFDLFHAGHVKMLEDAMKLFLDSETDILVINDAMYFKSDLINEK